MGLTLRLQKRTRDGRRKAREPRAARRAPREALELRALQDLRTVVGSARLYDGRIKRSTGLSGSQLWALAEVARAAGLTVNELAARLALHQTTASNLVNALVGRRLLKRIRDRRDQRIAARDLDQLARGLNTLREAMRRAAPAAAGELLFGD